MRIKQKIISTYPAGMRTLPHHAYKYFVRTLMEKIRKGYDYAKLSPQAIGGDLFTIKLTVATRIAEERESLLVPDHLAKKIADHNIKSIIIGPRAKEAHVVELIAQILDPDHKNNIEIFDRPNIQVITRQRAEQAIKAKEDNPYQDSIQRLYQACKRFDQLSIHEQDFVIKWLEHVLSDKDNKIWNKFYNPSQAPHFRGELKKIRRLTSES